MSQPKEDITVQCMRAHNSVLRNKNHILRCSLKTMLDNPSRVRERALWSVVGTCRKHCNGPIVKIKPKRLIPCAVYEPQYYTPICPRPVSRKEDLMRIQSSREQFRVKELPPPSTRVKLKREKKKPEDSDSCMEECPVVEKKSGASCGCPNRSVTKIKSCFSSGKNPCVTKSKSCSSAVRNSCAAKSRSCSGSARSSCEKKTGPAECARDVPMYPKPNSINAPPLYLTVKASTSSRKDSPERCPRRCCTPGAQSSSAPVTMSPLCCPPRGKRSPPKKTCGPIVRSYRCIPPSARRQLQDSSKCTVTSAGCGGEVQDNTYSTLSVNASKSRGNPGCGGQRQDKTFSQSSVNASKSRGCYAPANSGCGGQRQDKTFSQSSVNASKSRGCYAPTNSGCGGQRQDKTYGQSSMYASKSRGGYDPCKNTGYSNFCGNSYLNLCKNNVTVNNQSTGSSRYNTPKYFTDDPAPKSRLHTVREAFAENISGAPTRATCATEDPYSITTWKTSKPVRMASVLMRN